MLSYAKLVMLISTFISNEKAWVCDKIYIKLYIIIYFIICVCLIAHIIYAVIYAIHIVCY